MDIHIQRKLKTEFYYDLLDVLQVLTHFPFPRYFSTETSLALEMD